MSNALRPVWERYVTAWKAGSPAEKRVIFGDCLSSACVYSDPLTVARGWDELEAYMLAFNQQLPGAHFVTEQFFAHHDRSVARWTMRDARGVAIGDGISYAEYDAQQRLKTMTGFFEPPQGPPSA